MRIYFALAIILVACSSQYEKAETAYKNGDLEGAKEFYLSITEGDVNFEEAKKKLQEIDSIESRKMLNLALKYFNNEAFEDAKPILFNLLKGNFFKTEAREFITKIDSIQTSKTVVIKAEIRMGKIRTLVDGYDVKGVNLYNSAESNRSINCFLTDQSTVKIVKEVGEYFFVENDRGCSGYRMKGFVVEMK